MKNGTNIVFDAKKNFTYIKPLGSGGTGDTHLFKDETTEMLFAIKKYAPKDKRYIDEQYYRFVDEIKILFNIHHPNIVRIYNYYLFPEYKTGYLQMEYIEGITIDKYNPLNFTKTWNNIFIETVLAFLYLEDKNILHRDIRPSNIIIDSKENVKIIDFGFGKLLQKEVQNDNSIILNWPNTIMPKEVKKNHDYNHQTDIYFLGCLFNNLIKDDKDFRYNYIINKMIKTDPKYRYVSFFEIEKDISVRVVDEASFSQQEKEIYQKFADELISVIHNHTYYYKPIKDVDIIKSKLAEVLISSSLEECIQDNRILINCFIKNDYRFSNNQSVKVSSVKNFYNWIINLPYNKQKIIYDNIYNRLARIDIQQYLDDELPF